MSTATVALVVALAVNLVVWPAVWLQNHPHPHRLGLWRVTVRQVPHGQASEGHLYAGYTRRFWRLSSAMTYAVNCERRFRDGEVLAKVGRR